MKRKRAAAKLPTDAEWDIKRDSKAIVGASGSSGITEAYSNAIISLISDDEESTKSKAKSSSTCSNSGRSSLDGFFGGSSSIKAAQGLLTSNSDSGNSKQVLNNSNLGNDVLPRYHLATNTYVYMKD